MTSTHVGTVNLLDNDDEYSVLTLHDVLLVPELRHNLISVRALNRGGLDVSFRRDGTVLIADQDDVSYEIGQTVGDIHQLTPPKAYTATKKPDNHILWHHRLGHPNQKILDSIQNHVIGVEIDRRKNRTPARDASTPNHIVNRFRKSPRIEPTNR